jgi:hypothetical protein
VPFGSKNSPGRSSLRAGVEATKTHLETGSSYLLILGVDPTWHRPGTGAALMRPVFAAACCIGLCCYLAVPTHDTVHYSERRDIQVLAATDVATRNIQI